MRACDLNLCIDLHRLRQIPTLAASRLSAATPSTNPLNRVGSPRVPQLRRSNPHSARGTTACQFPRFPPLEVFVRRPPARVAPLSWAGIRKPSHNRTHALQQQGCHSITSSASESRLSEILMPRFLAVFRLI